MPVTVGQGPLLLGQWPGSPFLSVHLPLPPLLTLPPGADGEFSLKQSFGHRRNEAVSVSALGDHPRICPGDPQSCQGLPGAPGAARGTVRGFSEKHRPSQAEAVNPPPLGTAQISGVWSPLHWLRDPVFL